ncbi:MAG TPA: hypothetical protein VF480_06690, partial [Verrucomicrobiae bacterium]
DGLRRRFHAMLDDKKLHLVLDNDRFARGKPIVLKNDFSEIRFQIESGNPAVHVAILHISGLTPGKYNLRDRKKLISTVEVRDGLETIVEIPMEPDDRPKSLIIARGNNER